MSEQYELPAYTALKHETTTERPAYTKSGTQEIQDYLKPTSTKSAQINYLLDKLQEESAEVIQAVSKIRRFGQNASHPDRQTSNYQDLIVELEDFLAILASLESCTYIDLTQSREKILAKTRKLLS